MALSAAQGAPDISVVLATYNRRRTLPRAIASVLAQEGAAFELIIVDDASRDDTAHPRGRRSPRRPRRLSRFRRRLPAAAPRGAARSLRGGPQSRGHPE